jgi:hypothetical protein
MPVISIANLNDLFDYLSCGQAKQFADYMPAIRNYRAKYGVV